ncbi:transposase [Exiguobacterium acetylicum]|uniref:transposase n=1 Tax=Exiguobacterium acetylicum TaxID=41170 RepID=UPI003977E355
MGKFLFSKWKVEVESVFGSIKQNWSFRRFRLGGLERPRLKFRLVDIAYNLRKLAKNHF